VAWLGMCCNLGMAASGFMGIVVHQEQAMSRKGLFNGFS